MDGKRIQQYWSNEMDALLKTYKQFQILIPSSKTSGSAHNGEDGRYIENLIKEYLQRFLPKNLEVLTGFILRPAVKTGLKSKQRRTEIDSHSSQLDLIIYDSFNYPIFQRFGDNVIVPPEGVIGIISVKKTLSVNDILNEATALKNAAKLCKTIDNSGNKIRGPFLSLVSMDSFEQKKITTEKIIFDKLIEAYSIDEDFFDDLLGYIGSFNKWSIFKRRPKKDVAAEYIYFEHKEDEQHLGFQFLLTGLLSVYYDTSRNHRARPGFTGFPSYRDNDVYLGKIKVKALR